MHDFLPFVICISEESRATTNSGDAGYVNNSRASRLVMDEMSQPSVSRVTESSLFIVCGHGTVQCHNPDWNVWHFRRVAEPQLWLEKSWNLSPFGTVPKKRRQEGVAMKGVAKIAGNLLMS